MATKSNTLLVLDIIGSPSNYPQAWKDIMLSGNRMYGTPLIVAEDGTSLLPNGTLDTFKLSRKANATPLLCLRSTDSGATWTSFTPTFSTTTNAITLTDEPTNNLVMVYYQTKTSMATPTVNSEVLEIGDIKVFDSNARAMAANSLIGKTTVGTGYAEEVSFKINSYSILVASPNKLSQLVQKPEHASINVANMNSNTAVKVFPYLTRLNGKAYLNLVFKEMKHNGTSWGDSNKFEIVDNVSTTTDNNAQTVLIGQKTVELNVFIANDE